MYCPVCKGSGMSPIPHVPAAGGGWMDEKYSWSGIECGACNGTGRAGETDDPEQAEGHVPNADEQLREAVASLSATLEYSRVFPAELTRPWIDALKRLDVWEPDEGWRIVADLEYAFRSAKIDYRPVRDVFSLSPSNEMTFERECSRVENGLAYLEQLMDHCAEQLREDPDLAG